MASASNLARGGASYDIRLNDRITAGLDQIIHKLRILDKVGGKITQPLKSIQKSMNSLGKSSYVTAISTAFTAVLQGVRAFLSIMKTAIRLVEQFGRAAISAFSSIVTEASHATETLNAFNAVFKDQAKGMVDFTDSFSDAVGRSATDMRNYAKSFQAFFVGLGLASEKSALLSRNLLRLNTDFGSLFERSDEEVFRRLIAALSGSSEVLDSFGINIRENRMEEMAERLGYGGNVRKMTELQKALARLAIITEVLTTQGAIGDAIRTQFEWANQTKALLGAFKDLKAFLGAFAIAAFLPLLQSIVRATQMIKNNLREIIKAGGVDQFIKKLGVMGQAIKILSQAVQLAGMSIIDLDYKLLISVFTRLGKLIGLAILRGMISVLNDFGNFLGSIGPDIAKGLWDWFYGAFEGKAVGNPFETLFNKWARFGRFAAYPLEDLDARMRDITNTIENDFLQKGGVLGGKALENFLTQLEDIQDILKGEVGKQEGAGGGPGRGGGSYFAGTTSSFVARRLAAFSAGNQMDKLLVYSKNSLQVQEGMLDRLDEILRQRNKNPVFK